MGGIFEKRYISECRIFTITGMNFGDSDGSDANQNGICDLLSGESIRDRYSFSGSHRGGAPTNATQGDEETPVGT